MSIRYIDLFAGVGGFHYGLDTASRETNSGGETPAPGNESQGQGLQSAPGQADGTKNGRNDHRPTVQTAARSFTCVYSNEWDRYANSVYRRHYGECDIRDIRKVMAEEIPDHELLVCGFPCQAFSVAGKRGGFDDTRGTLFFEIARILNAKHPRLLLLENVKGLLSHDNGRTFKTIISALDELGYDLQWQVLNSKDFGVPQNRERIYIVGHLRGTPRPQVFPFSGGDRDLIPGDRQGTKSLADTVTAHYGHRNGRGTHVEVDSQFLKASQKLPDAMRVRGVNGNSVTLKSLGGGMGAKTGLYATPAIRRLTPVECERLQGFPDNWTKEGFEFDLKEGKPYFRDGKFWFGNFQLIPKDVPMSDTQRYKMMGNAVTTRVIAAIGKRLLNA